MSIFGKERPEEPREHPACPCGCRQFTAGGQAVSPWFDGRRCGVEPAGAVLTCLSCGERWYTSPDGLKRPARDAMPPAWAAMDFQREQQEAREKARREMVPSRPPASKRLSVPVRQ